LNPYVLLKRREHTLSKQQLVVIRYISFLASNAKRYQSFNRELFVGELGGIAAGILMAELAIAFAFNETGVSIISSVSDYVAAFAGFVVIFYIDNRGKFSDLKRKQRVKKVLVMVLRLWPSVAAADIAFLFIRPYIQYILLAANIEVGVTSVLAHFIAFAVFNIIAIFSRSIIEFSQLTLRQYKIKNNNAVDIQTIQNRI
jgi:hypothetical protein